jgi:hypothetical protein
MINSISKRDQQGPVVRVEREICSSKEYFDEDMVFFNYLKTICSGHGYTIESTISKGIQHTHGKNKECIDMSVNVSCGNGFTPQTKPAGTGQKGK